MWVALSSHCLSNCNPQLATHSHSNSPATSKISCHTSQLCAQEVGITNHPPLRIKPALQTAKKGTSTKHRQHTSKHRRSQQSYQASNRILNPGTCGRGPSRFRCATLIAEINHRFITSFNLPFCMRPSSVHPLIATLPGT